MKRILPHLFAKHNRKSSTSKKSLKLLVSMFVINSDFKEPRTVAKSCSLKS